MSKYTSKVDELFSSTGFFPTEYKEFLYNLDLSEQKDFIEELYIEYPDCVKWLSSDILYQNCINKLKVFDNGKEYLKSKGIKTNDDGKT